MNYFCVFRNIKKNHMGLCAMVYFLLYVEFILLRDNFSDNICFSS